MTPEQWQRVFALVKASQEREESERALFLVENCGNDEEIQNAARSLLLAQKQMGSFLEQPGGPLGLANQDTEHVSFEGKSDASVTAKATSASAKVSHALSRGAMLGRYMVLNPLGTGGMGVVYAAYDSELDRKLAIKLLHPEASNSLLGSDGRARLLREAQAMARLSHTNVIAVHDVGTLGDEVFIAMEYVDGCTLKKWLEAQKRPWPEIVAMFVQAGRGLSAAHSAGIVHRDFKPDNVLVAKNGHARVLDFGLARDAIPAETAQTVQVVADGQSATTISLKPLADGVTKAGTLIGTPAYMAPEQIVGGQVDAGTDQFSFCAALYQALYGELPFEGDTLSKRLAAIREGHLRHLKASAKVPGWLREVVLKGLQPQPEARHASMDVLLNKLQQNPAKLWRRASAIAATALLVILAPWVSYRVVVHRNSQLCKGAEQKMLGVWDEDRKRSVEAAFLAAGESSAAEAFTQTKKVLDKYAQSWVRVQTNACEATHMRGEQSEELLDLRMQCLSQRREELRALIDLFAAADAKLVQRSAKAAQTLTSLDDCSNAEALKAPVRPPADPATRAKVEALRKAVAKETALHLAGQISEALPLATEIVSQAKAVHYPPLEAEALFLLGRFQLAKGDHKSAEQSVRDAILAAEVGRDDAILAKAWTLLVAIAANQDHPQQAHEWAKHAFAKIERAGGSDTLLAGLFTELGNLFDREGQYEQALAHFQKALALKEKLLVGPQDREIAACVGNIGIALDHLGRMDEALAHFQRALAINEKALGPTHPDVASALNSLAIVLHRRGKYEEARQLYERALAIKEKALGPSSPDVANCLNNLGATYEKLGEYDQAFARFEQALAIREKALGPVHGQIAQSLVNIGSLLSLKGNHDQALEYYQRALDIYERAFGPESPRLSWALTGIGREYVELHFPQKSIAILERSLSLVEQNPGNKTLLASTRFALARALTDSRRDVKRARLLATMARDAYAANGEASKTELAKVDKWLDASQQGFVSR